MVEKRREVEFTSPRSWNVGYQEHWDTDPSRGIITPMTGSPISFTEVTESTGHGWPSPTYASTDVGGDFSTSKVKSLTSSDTGVRLGKGYYSSYEGQQWASNPYDAARYALSLVEPASPAKLEGLGTTAIANCLPTNPVADGATFIGELKSGLPKLVGKELFKTKFKDYRKVGSEYLNVEFGWKPLISDLQKFAKATIESEKIIEQLQRDSGRPIHRKYSFPDEINAVPKYIGNYNAQAWINGAGVHPACFYDVGGGPLYIEQSIETKTWFSGCFTYHLNLGNTLPDRISRNAALARKLYGLELTPEVVWNLAPWSWIVDWEGNIGDVLHNVSRFSQDGLVMQYGYIMQQKTAKVNYTLHMNGKLNRGPRGDLQMEIVAQSKTRRRATPFGFGFDMKGLTGRQSAILGALGMSRGPRG